MDYFEKALLAARVKTEGEKRIGYYITKENIMVSSGCDTLNKAYGMRGSTMYIVCELFENHVVPFSENNRPEAGWHFGWKEDPTYELEDNLIDKARQYGIKEIITRSKKLEVSAMCNKIDKNMLDDIKTLLGFISDDAEDKLCKNLFECDNDGSYTKAKAIALKYGITLDSIEFQKERVLRDVEVSRIEGSDKSQLILRGNICYLLENESVHEELLFAIDRKKSSTYYAKFLKEELERFNLKEHYCDTAIECFMEKYYETAGGK